MEATIDWSMGSRAAALIDWGTVSQTGRRVGGSGPPTPAVERARMREDLAEVVPYAETLIQEFTGLSSAGRSPARGGAPIGSAPQGPGGADRRAPGLRLTQGARPVRRVPAGRRRGDALLRRAEPGGGRAPVRAAATRLPVVGLDPRGDPPCAVRRDPMAPSPPGGADRSLRADRAGRFARGGRPAPARRRR